jgi:hypothetical protein
MVLDKINWKSTFLTLWVVFSFVYIAYSIYNNFRVNVIQNAYTAGQNDTVKAFIMQAENKECKPFNVYMGDKKVDLVNLDCLQKQQPTAEQSSPNSEAKK